MSHFIAHDLALELITSLREPLAQIAKRDRDLARQLRRAAASIALNLAEGSGQRAGHRRERFRTAAGSAAEVKSALQVAAAFGYADVPLGLADRVAGITYKLAR